MGWVKGWGCFDGVRRLWMKEGGDSAENEVAELVATALLLWHFAKCGWIPW